MPEAASQLQSASAVIRLLREMHRLTLAATRSPSRPELIFHILNQTCKLVPYQRALLWTWRGTEPVLLGVSGQTEVNSQAPLVCDWLRLLTGAKPPRHAEVLTAECFPHREDEWRALGERTRGLAALWLPIPLRDGTRLALWLERWGEASWHDEERAVLSSLMQGYGVAWERFPPSLSWRVRRFFSARRRSTAALLALALVLPFLVPVRMRVTAPCEVAPRDPVAITAPLDGVIEALDVTAGQTVTAGQMLFHYEDRVMLKELEVTRRRRDEIAARLQRAEIEAFSAAAARARVPALRARLRQENARLDLARNLVGRLQCRAPRGGVVLIENPHAWRGKAVRIGEPVMTLVQPGRTILRIHVAEDDNINFDRTIPVQVLLNVRPTDRRRARIVYTAAQVRQNAKGVAGVLVEARWLRPQPDLKLGWQGTAIVFGRRVNLAYWIMRKPLAWVRRLLGI